MRINKLKKLMDDGKTAAGMGIFTGDPVLIELIGHAGFDFVFIDTEHTPFSQSRELENLVRTTDAVGMSAVIRVAANDEIMIRKCFEFGAAAVVIPHARTAEEVRRMVAAAKFPLDGIRGSASECRAAGYGAAPDFNWQEYVCRSNQETMIIPMAEDAEFFENIDEIMRVEGVSSYLFGPNDLALSMGIAQLYQFDNPVIKEKFELLVKKAKEKQMPLACAFAPTLEKAREMADNGVRLMIFRTDITNFKIMLQGMVKDVVNPIRASINK